MASQWELISDVIPDDHHRQVDSTYYVDLVMTGADPPELVVDLGCGIGSSRERFLEHNPDIMWVGVDVAGTPESDRRGQVPNVVLYDGERLPFRTGSVPLIYSHQVLEHVARPWIVLAEVARVLTPDGLFIGSTSQFEPYHSLSRWGYTPYGFRMLAQDAGLDLLELRPAIDGISLITRAYEGNKPEHLKWFYEESPLNLEIDEWGTASNRRPALVNNRKLVFCGQFAFMARPAARGDGAVVKVGPDA